MTFWTTGRGHLGATTGLLLLAAWTVRLVWPLLPTEKKPETRRLIFRASEFRSGDILFRRGRSLLSRGVLSADGASDYSHVGLVSVAADQITVIHSVPAESTLQRGGVVKESLAAFLAGDKASTAALYRPKTAGSGLIAARAADRFVSSHYLFDSSFDLKSADELYCTELIWRAYLEAGVDLVGYEVGQSSEEGKYLLPSDLQGSSHLYLVRRIQEVVPNE